MSDRPLRSLLFVPGDSEKKLAKIGECGADAVILDLEDSVATPNKKLARRLVAEFLAQNPQSPRTPQLWVRINPLDSGLALADLAAVAGFRPDGIMQPKSMGLRTCADCRIISTRWKPRTGYPRARSACCRWRPRPRLRRFDLATLPALVSRGFSA